MSVFLKNLFSIPLVLFALFAAATGRAQVSSIKLDGERFGHAAVVRGNDIFLVGGMGKTGWKETIERFDAKTGAHEIIPTTLLPRLFTTAQIQNDTIYVFGGIALDKANTATPVSLTAVAEKFDLKTRKVTRLAPVPRPLRAASSFLCNGRIYLVGGAGGAGDNEPRLATVFIYDTANNAWTNGPSLSVARETAVAFFNNHAYAVGGYDGKKPVSLVESLDLGIYNGAWVPLPPTPNPVSANKTAVWGNAVYSFGDYSNGKLVLRYDIARRAWQQIDIPLSPIRHSAVVVVDNKVFVLGGNSNDHKTGVDTIQVFPIR